MKDEARLSPEILVDEEKIRERVSELAGYINKDFAGRNPVIISVLNGSYILAADLTRRLTIRYSLDFVSVRSTDGSSTGRVNSARLALETDISGRDVILLDDIYDSGETLFFLKEAIQKLDPSSVSICVFVEKSHRRPRKEVRIDYLGFTLPDKWLVGYGMDFNGDYRGLPYIGFVKDGKRNL